jgi:hypothetical protein
MAVKEKRSVVGMVWVVQMSWPIAEMPPHIGIVEAGAHGEDGEHDE